MAQWQWYGEPEYKYRDERGRFASQAQIWKFGQESIDSSIAKAREAALTMTPGDFEKTMRQLIKNEVIRQYVLGAGGQEQLTKADYGSMGGIIADQYRYLDKLIAKFEAGEYTPQKVAALAQMYINSCREAYERANARARGLPQMPDYPGSGSTKCLTNCRCHWEYHFRKGRWECYWNVARDEASCEPCLDNGAKWSPLLISKEGEFI